MPDLLNESFPVSTGFDGRSSFKALALLLLESPDASLPSFTSPSSSSAAIPFARSDCGLKSGAVALKPGPETLSPSTFGPAAAFCRNAWTMTHFDFLRCSSDMAPCAATPKSTRPPCSSSGDFFAAASRFVMVWSCAVNWIAMKSTAGKKSRTALRTVIAFRICIHSEPAKQDFRAILRFLCQRNNRSLNCTCSTNVSGFPSPLTERANPK